MSEFCPECLKKDLELKDLQREKKAAEEKHASELAAANAKTPPAPSLAALLEHAKSCPNCQKELQAHDAEVLTKGLSALNLDQITRLARDVSGNQNAEFIDATKINFIPAGAK